MECMPSTLTVGCTDALALPHSLQDNNLDAAAKEALKEAAGSKITLQL